MFRDNGSQIRYPRRKLSIADWKLAIASLYHAKFVVDCLDVFHADLGNKQDI